MKYLNFLYISIVSTGYLFSSPYVNSAWDNDDYLQKAVTSFIESRFSDKNLPGKNKPTVPPERCMPLKFGYRGGWEADDGLNYQISFANLSVECWERLKQVVPSNHFKLIQNVMSTQPKFRI
jgi:hypothetical protein